MIKLDEWWCSQALLPAKWLQPFVNDNDALNAIIISRMTVFACTLTEILGMFFIVIGLLPSSSIWVLFLGGFLKISGLLTARAAQNHSGSLWQRQLAESLSLLRTRGTEVRSVLAHRGLTANEISALQNLPNELYQSEVSSYPRQRMLMIGVPLACSSGLLIANDQLTALLVFAIGCAAHPVTEFFYNRKIRVVDEKLRVGRVCGQIGFLNKALWLYEKTMLRINVIGQLPLVLFIIRYGFGVGIGKLASFYGITQGLQGLSEALAVQRSRVSSSRAAYIGKQLLEALASPSLLIANGRWRAHIQDSPALLEVPCRDGIVLVDFAVASAYPRRLPPISACLPSGKSTLLKAPSGHGKSLLMLAIATIVDHTGQMYFIRDGKATNTHLLPQRDVSRSIFARRDADLDRATRIVDIFKPALRYEMQRLYDDMRIKWGEELTEVVWGCGDARLSRQTAHPSALPRDMFAAVDELRRFRVEIVDCWLADYELPLSALRSFGSLSSGERRRVLTLAALKWSLAKAGSKLVILDEPFANLDMGTLDKQISLVSEIEASGASLLVISHRILANFSPTIIDPFQDE